MPPDEISPQQNSPQNGIHPSGASDSSLEAPEPSHNSTLENITNLAGTILTELPLELPALEFFYEAPSEVLSDDGSVAEPQRIASQSQLVKAEVNKLLDEYEELDVGNLDESVRSSLKRLLRHVIAQQRKPKRVKLRDKILFVLGTCDLWASAFWLGKSPYTFVSLYMWKAIVLFSIRWIDWKRKKLHYYLYDWCYCANIMLMVGLKCLPLNIPVLKACFAFSLGPLAWSILTFRNSLVYHSVEKITTLFLHLYPACVTWAARWYPSPLVQARLDTDAEFATQWNNAGVTQLVIIPMLPYLLWGVLYYLKIFVVSSDRIRERGYHTLFKYVTSKPSFYGQLISAAPAALQPLVYMSFHLAMTMLTMALCTLWWSNYWASSAFIVIMFVIAAVNGANYYFEVFARRYISDLGQDATPSPKPHGTSKHD